MVRTGAAPQPFRSCGLAAVRRLLALPPPPAPQVSHITVVIVCNNLIDDYLTPIRQSPIPWLRLKLYRQTLSCSRALSLPSIMRREHFKGRIQMRWFGRPVFSEANKKQPQIPWTSRVTPLHARIIIIRSLMILLLLLLLAEPRVSGKGVNMRNIQPAYQVPNPRSLVAAQPASSAKCNAMQVNQYIRLISKSTSFTKKFEWVIQKRCICTTRSTCSPSA